MKARRKEATRLLAELGANVDAWYAGQLNYEAFGARQRATWDAIHAASPAVAATACRPPAPITKGGRDGRRHLHPDQDQG